MEKNEQEILQEENELSFNQFNHHDAWLIGNEILRLYCGSEVKPTGIRELESVFPCRTSFCFNI